MEIVKSESQRKRIAEHLKSGNSITPLEALKKFDCFRLASRISEIKKDGLIIRTEMVRETTGKTFARYHYEGMRNLN